MANRPIDTKSEFGAVANLDALDPDHFSVVWNTDDAGRAVIVYYWGHAYTKGPSDSRRMFWFGARS